MARAFIELYTATGDTTYLRHAQRFADTFIEEYVTTLGTELERGMKL